MRAVLHRAAQLYGDRLFHLVVVTAALAFGAYAVATLGIDNLFNPVTGWQSIAVWFAVAVIAHDLVLFPLYSLLDRLIPRAAHRRSDGVRAPGFLRVPVVNYARIPTMAAGLLLLMFLPGIIRQGAFTYEAATGLTQEPFRGRWLLIVAAFYLISFLCYLAATAAQRVRWARSMDSGGSERAEADSA